MEVDEYPSTLVVFSTVVKNIDIGDYIIISVLTLRCLTCFMFAFYYIVSKPILTCLMIVVYVKEIEQKASGQHGVTMQEDPNQTPNTN